LTPKDNAFSRVLTVPIQTMSAYSALRKPAYLKFDIDSVACQTCILRGTVYNSV
jgi:hypothetical protein